MKKHLLFLTLTALLTFVISPGIFSQTTESARFNPEEYVGRYGYITPESPLYYLTQNAFSTAEKHILDTLTKTERQIIEDAYDPPAVGIIRDLNPIIQFNLDEVEIPENGEISTSGGRLTRVSEDLLVFTTYIQSTKADELRLFFAEGNFPRGVKVNLFSRDDYAFTQPELKGTLDEYGFYTTTTFADYITLQVEIPFKQLEENLYFTITKIIHAENRYMPEEDPTRSCFLDANCSDANSFTHISAIREATARLFFPSEGKYGLCSGGLLIDIRDKDWQPFLLTANHCFSTQSSAAGLEARFEYWSTYCNSGVVNPNQVIINGANLISTNSQTDFTLVLLKHQSFGYYLGWDPGSVSNNTTMHSTHHPGGTLMKYQRMTNKTSPSHSCSGFSTSDFYYTKTTHGQEEPGSSGGLIVDPFGRVRGQLYGWCYEAGADRCNYDTYNNMWGRFDKSYSINNLGYWLYNGGSSVAISTSPGSSYNYGTENIGSYEDHTFTVNNSGSRPNYLNLEAGNAYIGGTNANQFSIIGATFLYLAPGESGTFTVRFQPTSSGTKTATLNIPHNADNYSSPKVITLTGYGNPCSDIVSLGGGGNANTKTFSKSGTGSWISDFCGYDCNGQEQVYSFVAPVTGIYRIEVTSTNSSWVDYFWKSGSCGSTSWNCINDVYSPSTQGSMSWTAGQTYYILLDDENATASTHSFYVYYDPCANIINIPGINQSQTYQGGGNGIWNTSSVSPCGYYCYGIEQIYSFTPSITGNYAVHVTSGGSYVDYMWKSGSCSENDWLCIDDIYSSGTYGELFWTAGETYYLLLDDENTSASNHEFELELTEGVGTWTGLVNHNWNLAGNWSFNVVPDNTIDVTIPDGTPYDPHVIYADGECHNLTLETGASLTIGAYNLQINQVANMYGSLTMDQEDGSLTTLGDIIWYSGSSLTVNDYSTFINVYGTWEAKSGSDLSPGNGFVDFKGNQDGYIRSYDADNAFYNVRVYKTDGAELGHSALSTQALHIENLLFVSSAGTFTNYSSADIIIEGSFNCYGSFDFTLNNNDGNLIFGGTYSGLNLFTTGSGLFNNIVFSASTLSSTQNDIQVKGDFTIEEGVFDANGHEISLGGNWTNTVGPDGFDESGSRVIFNGPGHQYVYGDEDFNVLEVNNGAALRLNNASYDVTCNTYDWTAGGIDIVAGNFTALDLADNGLFGGYWVNPAGVINLTNDGWVDLNGEIHNFGGILNVSGTVSDWPYSADALIEMTSGVIDFKTCGISMIDNANSLTANISGGTIRTAYNFSNQRSDVDLSDLTVEMYGPTGASISLDPSSPISDLNISKVAAMGDSPIIENEFIQLRDGTKVPLSKDIAVTAGSDLLILNNLNIESGIFDVSAYQVTVENSVLIYGTVKMTDPLGDLTAHYIEWGSGSEDNVIAGTFHAHTWLFSEGTNAKIGTGNTAYLEDMYFPTDDDAEFGNLVVQNNSKQLKNPEGRANYPTRVSGDFTITDGKIWGFFLEGAGLLVDGNASIEAGTSLSIQSANDFVVGGDIEIAGTLNINSEASATVHGAILWPETGSLIINSGEVVFDSPNHPDKGWEYINGHLTLTEGLFEITNNSTNFGATATTSISGGVIRTGGAFRAVNSNVFEPTGGTVEIIGDVPDLAIYCYGGNYFYNLLINREPGNYCQSFGGEALEIKNNLSILSGALNSGSSTMFVGGNWANYVGPDGFIENNNVVWFYGETYSHILTDETFYDLYIFDYLTDRSPAKGSRIVEETYIDENVTVNVSNNCSILGGSLNLGSNSALDVEQNLSISLGAELIVPDMTIAEIFVGGNFDDYNASAGFLPGYSTFTFDGSLNQELNLNSPINNFYNLVINNSDDHVSMGGGLQIFGDLLIQDGAFLDSGIDYFHYFHGDVSIEPDGALLPYRVVSFIGDSDAVFTDNSTGSSYFQSNIFIDKEGPNIGLSLETNMLLLSGASMIVNEGFLDLNTNLLRCTGDVSVNSGGILTVDEGAELEVGSDKQLLVQNGGIIEVLGVAGNQAKVSAWNAPNYYYFEILPGGTIRAEHAIFEYMKSYRGVNVDAGGIVDPMYSFNYCTFRNGDNASSSVLLAINNDQILTITGASFPNATMEYNVAKEGNAGHLTFVDFSGVFAGEEYEYDPYNLIDWYVPTLEAIPLVQNVGAPAGSTTFDIISNLEWTSFENSTWFSISPGSGIGNGFLTVTYQANNTFFSRTGEILLTADGVPDVILTVNQAAIEPTLSVTPAIRNVTSPAGQTTFSLTSNTSWTVSEGVGWFSVSPMSGTNNKTLVVTYQENTLVTNRTGQITISASGVPDVVVSVIQAGTEPYIEIMPDVEYVNAAAGSIPFNLSSNTDWEIVESYGWLSMNPSSGVGNDVITVDYQQNATGSPRQAIVTITANGGALSVDYVISQETYYTHQIEVPGGWSGLSSYIMPAENSITDVMAPLSPNFVILTTMESVFYPDGAINTIGNWQQQSAYKIKLSSASILDIVGNEETSKTYDMNPGWNLVPVISNVPVDAETLFGSVDFEIVKDVAGFGMLWPDYGINTLGVFVPGRTYLSLMNTSGSITFPPNAKNSGGFTIPETAAPSHPWDEIHYGPSTHSIAIIANGISGAMPGDVIGIFDDSGKCFGIAEIANINDNTAITAFADDPYTYEKDGYEVNDPMSVKLFRPATSEVFPTEVIWDDRLPNSSFFENDGISAISGLKVSSIGINEALASSITIRPNPSNGMVEISGIQKFMHIEIFNVGGEMIRTFANNNENLVKLNLTDLPAGIYQIKFTGHESSLIKKLIRK